MMTEQEKQQILNNRPHLLQDQAPECEYPKYIYGRYFESHQEYQDAVHEFLNAN